MLLLVTYSNVCVLDVSKPQGCSLCLERLGLETFFGTSRSREFGKVECLRLVSVSRVQRLGLVSVLKI